jgi:hypothetical protein
VKPLASRNSSAASDTPLMAWRMALVTAARARKRAGVPARPCWIASPG